LAKTGIALDSVLGGVLSTAVWVNLGFFVFNILPIPPLDGSRFLYALAPDFARKAMDAIEQFSIVIVLAIVLLFNDVIGSYMIGVIGWTIDIFAKITGVNL
jgi:Zn-dependent protease